ncbi:MAG: glycosyl hydrolase, partial [Chthoniobacteraceae bacterium]
GLRWVAAESFTARPAQAGWKSDPYSLKALGDLAFCTGVNRFMFSSYAAEPYVDKFPGFTLGPYGLNFGRTVTWWEQSRPWVDYISRCQWLLSQGRFVADVCYFYGEGAPNTLTSRGHLSPGIPEGYDYDGCDAETLQKMEVHDGRLTLPGGMSYRVLVLADSDRMTPGILKKVRDLVQAGAMVVGAPPSGLSPSLQDYPKADSEVKKLVEELWGAGDGKVVDKEHVSTQPLEKLFPQIGLPEDFSSTTMYPKLAEIHRKTDNADIYFVSNQANHAVAPECTFRVTGRVPELWHADTGVIETAPIYRQADGRTTIPLQLDPSGSVFVIFRKATGMEDAIVSMQRTDSKHNSGIQPDTAQFDLTRLGGEPAMLTPWVPGIYTATFASGKKWRCDVSGVAPARELPGPWMLRFPPKWGAPGQVTLEKLISWTDDPDDGVKHFSGTATYTGQFQVNDGELSPGKVLRLNLGEVKNLAELTVNGKNLGVLWKPPFMVDLTGIARVGTNTLEVKVTNLWPNRMIGDQKLPPEQRYTWSTNEPYQADSPLLKSGLIGPVTLQSTTTLRMAP